MRTIDVFVRDRNGHLITEGVEIQFSKNGALAGTIPDAEGRGRIQVEDRTSRIGVTATYQGATQTAQLAKNQDAYTFVFDVSVGSSLRDFMDKHVALVVGLLLIAVAITLTFTFNNPTSLQTRVIIGTFSLAGGAIATEISGMLRIDLSLGTKLAIGATGALAVFVILYLVLPA